MSNFDWVSSSEAEKDDNNLLSFSWVTSTTSTPAPTPPQRSGGLSPGWPISTAPSTAWPPSSTSSIWPIQPSLLSAPSQAPSSLNTATPWVSTPSIWDPTNPRVSSSTSASAFPLASSTSTSGTGSMDTDLGDDIDLMFDVVVEDMNPTTPLDSVKTFEELNLSESLLKAVYTSKFVKPSRIQEYALPYLLRDPPEHLIAQSQSGTGKTAAFALAVLSRIKYENDSTQALVLAPTRELARQIVMVFKELSQFTGVQIYEAIPEDGQLSAVMRKSHIVVGTPGTISNMLKRGKIVKEGVRILVLDEADHMLDLQGLGEQSNQIRRLLSPEIQVIMFSATWNDHVLKYATNIMHGKFNRIRLQVKHLVLKSIKALYLDCEDESDRFQMLLALYSLVSVSQSIIFVARRVTATKIGTMMREKGHSVAYLHGSMDTKERDDTIDGFRNACTKVLISTNVLARGIDVANVNLVVNYDLPIKMDGSADFETYIHRIGRTGRFGRIGVTVNFVHDEKSYQVMKTIQDFYGQALLKLPSGNSSEDSTTRLDRMEAYIKHVLKS